jgi:hypothetical protein
VFPLRSVAVGIHTSVSTVRKFELTKQRRKKQPRSKVRKRHYFGL